MTSTATCFTWRDIRKWSLTTVSYNGTGVRQVHVCSTSIAFPISVLQAKLFFFAATKIRIGRGRSLPLRNQQAKPFSPASIPKSGLEIKNRCTHEGINRQNLAAIRKSGPEIKNRCTKQRIPQHASCLGCLHGAGLTLVRQWRQKRVLMRPEAAFPYVFAAEGAQHPPKKPPRSTTRRHETSRSRHAQRGSSTKRIRTADGSSALFS